MDSIMSRMLINRWLVEDKAVQGNPCPTTAHALVWGNGFCIGVSSLVDRGLKLHVA